MRVSISSASVSIPSALLCIYLTYISSLFVQDIRRERVAVSISYSRESVKETRFARVCTDCNLMKTEKVSLFEPVTRILMKCTGAIGVGCVEISKETGVTFCHPKSKRSRPHLFLAY